MVYWLAQSTSNLEDVGSYFKQILNNKRLLVQLLALPGLKLCPSLGMAHCLVPS
jgi:hypothetical protein